MLTDDTNLETDYTDDEVTDVESSDDVRVAQTATEEYMIHQFKDDIGAKTACRLTWEGQSTLAPSSSTVYLQIYNRTNTTWDTVASNDSESADTDFTMIANISSLVNYKDASDIIACRVYQEAL